MSLAEQPHGGHETDGHGDRRPLYLRMYYQAHLSDLVRAIGYNSLPIDEARGRCEALMKQYGEPLMRAAEEEVLFIDATRDPAVVRLTDRARRLAVMLLGRPPDPSDAFPPSENPPAAGTIAANSDDNDDVPAAAVVVRRQPKPDSLPAVKAKRADVLKEFAAWLTAEREDFTTVDTREQSVPPDAKLRFVDFIVRKAGRQLLLAVRRSLKPGERQSLLEAERSLGAGTTALRTWPDEGPDGWVWRKYTLVPDAKAPDVDASTTP